MRRFEQLQGRIYRFAQTQEGDTPAEDPKELLAEADHVLGRIEYLICRINKTNTATKFDDKLTLTDAIAQRDILMKRRSLYANAADRAGATQSRYSRSEIRLVANVDVRETQRHADKLAKDYRTLDTAIQKLNWDTDLL